MSVADDRRALLERLQPYVQRVRHFSGWDFSFIDEKVVGLDLPWDYVALARKYARGANRVLDLGTGGGEVLSKVAAGQSASFVASEEWHVNAPVARDRLRALGVPVVRAKSDARSLPFRDGCFDLVLSRHEAVDPFEVDRVLAPGGVFLTQQVAPDNWPELTRFFPRKTVFPDHFDGYQDVFVRLGYEVMRQQHDLRVAYRTIGDVVAMLTITPWFVPDFDIGRDVDALLAVERGLTTPEGIVLTSGRYLIEARKPA